MTIKNALLGFVCMLSFGSTGFTQALDNQPAPITGTERVHWAIRSTVGPKSLVVGVFSSAWDTAVNVPEEYGPHWSGFAKRYGIRLTGIGATNTIEAGLGSLWNEDPRYVRSGKGTLLDHVKYAGRMTFEAERADGSLALAYVWFIVVPSANFISNSWRAHSDRSVGDALVRTALGFTGRFFGNLVQELW